MKCMERPTGEQVPGVNVSSLAANSTLAVCYSIDSEAANFNVSSATFQDYQWTVANVGHSNRDYRADKGTLTDEIAQSVTLCPDPPPTDGPETCNRMAQKDLFKTCVGSECSTPNSPAFARICPSGHYKTWSVALSRDPVDPPKMHRNNYDLYKDIPFCSVTTGMKTERVGPQDVDVWGYAKFDGIFHEVYSRVNCGRRAKILVCEHEPGKPVLCQNRKKCLPYETLEVWSVWAVPAYPTTGTTSKTCGDPPVPGKYPSCLGTVTAKIEGSNYMQYVTGICSSWCGWY